MKPIRNLSAVIFVIASITIASCGNSSDSYYPKSRGFFRIDLPEKKYVTFDSVYPFTCRIPETAQIVSIEGNEPGSIWFNLIFPTYNGSVNFSYKTINGNLYQLTEDAREFANKHIAKANEIKEIRVSHVENNVYGLIYDIEGSNSASPYQFYLTDSTKHYLRGAVYFNHIPNNDSIAPIIQRVKEDLDTLMGSLKWKN
ncbi:MAG: hypothetical protein A2W93_15955 [Bacteroidetes bacterium GWF2_43_63]|nr:MAG: hypothetical protein A2W94_13435 [Bacteroidetes bacterium GWE2_42_42]OFY53160.1 MAG: hypothetical protein A2W93_15955 [Bacteroidetes bacterium GWF2_43_63]HBG70325.1 gliding motility lipoprotein GldD [Bacteroidales bacterium]